MEYYNHTEDIPLLPKEMAQHWKVKLHSLRHSCGCKSGAAALLMSLAASLFYFFFDSGMVYSSREKILFISLLGFVSAIMGKVIGIVWARIRYYRLRRKLREEFPAIFMKQ
jgi:hypothetical protein